MGDACCGDGRDRTPDAALEAERLHQVPALRMAAVSGLLLAAGLAAGVGDWALASSIALVGALMVGGITFVPETLRAARRGRVNVGTLMTIAAAGAVALGELGEAATLAFLFSISEGLEGYALARTRRGLRALLDLVPPRARVVRHGAEIELDPSELVVGDVLVVRPGERLATDGVVRRGNSAVDVSAVTGESIPVEVAAGSQVFAATVNGSGVLEVEVTTVVAENSLARIIHLVEEAQERKAASQRLAERVARPLVPGVMVLAAVVAVAGTILGDPSVWLARSLVVLVAAAPCAFAISVPVTVVAAVGTASRHGVLVKGGAALEALGTVRAVALDKTGTLTLNRPRVVEVLVAPGSTREEVLGVAAALEARSEHPLAEAILSEAEQAGPADEVNAVPGHGVEGVVGKGPARLGKPAFVDPGPLAPEVVRLQAGGATVVVVEHDGRLLGAIAVRDDLRPEAQEAVAGLRGLGISTVAMLTGDNQRTAVAVAAAVGIEEVHADLLPEDKVRVVEDMQRRQAVAMVGDGINDAPALATARVGIAMGAMGVDVAIETADVALMGEDLRRLPEALAHGRRAVRILRQNLALSAAILLLLVPMAAAGELGLATVVAVHEVGEVLVIANGIRAGRWRPGLETIGARHEPVANGDHQDDRTSPALSATTD